MFYYSRFSSVRDVKFYDFLNNVIRNLVKLFFAEKIKLSKRPLSFLEPIDQKTDFFF